MNDLIKNTGKLKIDIETHHSDSETIPKQLQILGADLSVKQSAWMQGKTWDHDLQPGVYLVRLNLASGKQLEQIVEISDGHETKIDFDIGQFSPREDQEWMYLTKGTAGEKPVSAFRGNNFAEVFTKVSTKLWTYENNTWRSSPEPVIDGKFIDTVGETFALNVRTGMQVLEVVAEGKTPSFVCLPPSDSLKCVIKLAEGPEAVVAALDISFGTGNKRAQALLSLMNSGDMTRAKSLVSVEDAEAVLHDKMIDPAGAAIGGYFLLKTGELDRLHNWADNLANWFPWMPDGAVIHGWQLIHQGAQPNTMPMIRNRFIEAVNRGIPLYTEGLRLLYEGLTMLSYNFEQKDKAVQQAFARIKKYMCVADLSQENTTFTGSYPDQPGMNTLKDEPVNPLRPVEQIKSD